MTTEKGVPLPEGVKLFFLFHSLCQRASTSWGLYHFPSWKTNVEKNMRILLLLQARQWHLLCFYLNEFRVVLVLNPSYQS